eukprot:s2715_g7.t1
MCRKLDCERWLHLQRLLGSAPKKLQSEKVTTTASGSLIGGWAQESLVEDYQVATHPQSTSVFFERFVQLCASDHGDPHGPQVQQVPKTGEAEPVAHRNAQGRAFGANQEADDLASRPRVVLEVVDGAAAATLVFSGQCTRCQGCPCAVLRDVGWKLTLNEIFSQWLRPGAEETSAVQCPTCRHSGTVHLHINVASRSPVEIDLLHPKRLALALRGHLDARGRGKDPLGPAWLSGLASAPTLWTNLVCPGSTPEMALRRHAFFTEHLLTALGPEKVQNLAVEKIVARHLGTLLGGYR